MGFQSLPWPHCSKLRCRILSLRDSHNNGLEQDHRLHSCIPGAATPQCSASLHLHENPGDPEVLTVHPSYGLMPERGLQASATASWATAAASGTSRACVAASIL